MSRVGHHQPAYADLQGQFRGSYHLEMVSDRARVDAVLAALEETLQPDHVFCEVGCGSGLFAIAAARICRHVYAIEIDDGVASMAEANIAESGLADRITLIRGSALEVDLPERVDVALCELMSIWAVEEPILPVARRVQRDLLKPQGRLLPLRILNLAELGRYSFSRHGVRLPAVIPLFTGIPRPHILTESRLCHRIDLRQPVDLEMMVRTEYRALADGEINCAVLHSIVQMGPSVVFAGSDSLMPATVVPLEKSLEVREGERLTLAVELTARHPLDQSPFRVHQEP